MAKESYQHEELEKKAQEKWRTTNLYASQETEGKEKCYVLDMFPYPSGEGLHVGHPKGYIATDVYARHMRMQGKSVLHPMGWDAFGLPAENYALKNKVHPRAAVEKNVARFKDQLGRIGFDYDWSREVNTTDPEYYRWTQWIFLKLYEHGLAFRSEEPINWCPSCMTGLANEDLDQGRCERCGTLVVKKKLPQWVLKITDYAERLLTDLDTLDGWPEHIKESQRNWIGKSEGLVFTSPVKDTDMVLETFSAHFEAFRADTFVVIAPDHPLLPKLVEGVPEAPRILAEAAAMAAERAEDKYGEVKEPVGIFTGRYTIDPVGNGELPIWVANYALAEYGTGIVKCSAHDERDFAFAKKYGIPLKEVLEPVVVQDTGTAAFRPNEPVADSHAVIAIVKHWSEEKYLGLTWPEAGWGTFLTGGIEDGESPEETVLREIREETGYVHARIARSLGTIHGKYYHAPKQQNRFGHAPTYYVELEDGEQQEIPHEEKGKHELRWLTKEEMTPFLTPVSHQYAFKKLFNEVCWTDMENSILAEPDEFKGRVPAEAREDIVAYAEAHGLARRTTTYRLRDWVFSRQRYWGEPIPIVYCGSCGVVPVPYEDLPVRLPDVEHYEPTGTGESPLAAIDSWVNTACPKCRGAAKRETNTMPQWAGSSWYYLRYMDPHNTEALVSPEAEKFWAPVDMYVGGAEHATRHLIYARFWHKFLLDIGVVSTLEPFKKLHSVGLIIAEDGKKMSKRFGNVINPDDVVAEYGADAFRVYEMFMGPFENAIAWNTKSLVGSRRFLDRVWRASDRVQDEHIPALEQPLHQAIQKVGDDILNFRFNTAISQMMIFLNALEAERAIGREQWSSFLRILAPFAPHITEELWERLGEAGSIHKASWPSFDARHLESDTVTIGVQIAGKTRGEITISHNASEAEAVAAALLVSKVRELFPGGQPSRVIYRPGRILNLIP
ncbi:MAG TPA: class I tRNA ligase family protein [Candidatus Paceibacterota bacterium]|jgi:leucyl-tRNA synthetase